MITGNRCGTDPIVFIVDPNRALGGFLINIELNLLGRCLPLSLGRQLVISKLQGNRWVVTLKGYTCRLSIRQSGNEQTYYCENADLFVHRHLLLEGLPSAFGVSTWACSQDIASVHFRQRNTECRIGKCANEDVALSAIARSPRQLFVRKIPLGSPSLEGGTVEFRRGRAHQGLLTKLSSSTSTLSSSGEADPPTRRGPRSSLRALAVENTPRASPGQAVLSGASELPPMSDPQTQQLG